MRKRWFVAYIPPKTEEKIKQQLSKDFPDCECIYPKRPIVSVKNGKQKVKNDILFPNYMIVCVPIDDMKDDIFTDIVRKTQIIKFLTVEEKSGWKKPVPLDKKELTHIRNLMEITAYKYQPKQLIGVKVDIIKGPYKDFSGIVTKVIKGTGRMVIDVNLFGKIFAADIPLDYINMTHMEVDIYEEND